MMEPGVEDAEATFLDTNLWEPLTAEASANRYLADPLFLTTLPTSDESDPDDLDDAAANLERAALLVGTVGCAASASARSLVSPDQKRRFCAELTDAIHDFDTGADDAPAPEMIQPLLDAALPWLTDNRFVDEACAANGLVERCAEVICRECVDPRPYGRRNEDTEPEALQSCLAICSCAVANLNNRGDLKSFEAAVYSGGLAAVITASSRRCCGPLLRAGALRALVAVAAAVAAPPPPPGPTASAAAAATGGGLAVEELVHLFTDGPTRKAADALLREFRRHDANPDLTGCLRRLCDAADAKRDDDSSTAAGTVTTPRRSEDSEWETSDDEVGGIWDSVKKLARPDQLIGAAIGAAITKLPNLADARETLVGAARGGIKPATVSTAIAGPLAAAATDRRRRRRAERRECEVWVTTDEDESSSGGGGGGDSSDGVHDPSTAADGGGDAGDAAVAIAIAGGGGDGGGDDDRDQDGNRGGSSATDDSDDSDDSDLDDLTGVIYSWEQALRLHRAVANPAQLPPIELWIFYQVLDIATYHAVRAHRCPLDGVDLFQCKLLPAKAKHALELSFGLWDDSAGVAGKGIRSHIVDWAKEASGELEDVYSEVGDALVQIAQHDCSTWGRAKITADFYIQGHSVDGTRVLPVNDTTSVYTVVGVGAPLSETFAAAALPATARLTLLPFNGKIIHDGTAAAAAAGIETVDRMQLRTWLDAAVATAKKTGRFYTSLNPVSPTAVHDSPVHDSPTAAATPAAAYGTPSADPTPGVTAGFAGGRAGADGLAHTPAVMRMQSLGPTP